MDNAENDRILADRILASVGLTKEILDEASLKGVALFLAETKDDTDLNLLRIELLDLYRQQYSANKSLEVFRDDFYMSSHEDDLSKWQFRVKLLIDAWEQGYNHAKD